jgi:small-conductance mechanosensitive channel
MTTMIWRLAAALCPSAQVGTRSQGWARALVDVEVAYSTDLDDATRVIERVARELRARLKVAFDQAGIEVSAQKALTADSQGQPAA